MLKKLFLIVTLLSLYVSPLLAEDPPSQEKRLTVLQASEGEEGMGRFFDEFINMLFALGVIICALFVVGWILKKMLHTRVLQVNESSAIKILERRSISPKTAIYLIEVQGKTVLIGESPSGLAPLGDVPNASVATSFDHIMEEQKQKSES